MIDRQASELAGPAPPTTLTVPARPEQPSLLEPVREGERLAALDVLRGVALLGILFVNMQSFVMPFMAAFLGTDLRGRDPGEVAVWTFIQVFCQFKFISLFSLLFGAGLAIQMIRAQRARRPFVPMYLRRLAMLATFGLAHGLLLWYGDILFIYSIIGLLLMLIMLARPSAKALLWMGAGGVTISLLLGLAGGAFAVAMKSGMTPVYESEVTFEVDREAEAVSLEPGDELPSDDDRAAAPPDDELSLLERLEATGWDAYGEEWAAIETEVYREGPFAHAFIMRAMSFAAIVFQAPLSFGWRLLGMFCIGAGLLMLGFFSPERRAAAAWLAALGVLIGLPLECLAAFLQHRHMDSGFTFEFFATATLHESASFALCLGYLGGVTLMAHAPSLRWLTAPFAFVGRMALTNYILQTVIATWITYWWGLRLFGSLSYVEQFWLVLAIFACQMIFSAIWLRVFRMGPLEWLWRSLTYLRVQPLVR